MNVKMISTIPQRIGTCQNMCPENEIRIREKEGLLHTFERCDKNTKKADPLKMIKSFNRSAAGQKLNNLNDLRPPECLLKTINYMVFKIMSKKDVDWTIIYDFVFDRTRAIRQDMIIQNLNSPECLNILEIIVKFHVYSAYRLCNLPETKFDQTINKQHLIECIKRCLIFYDNNSDMENISKRSEMEGLYLLFNLGNPIILNRALNLPDKIRNTNFKTALEISLAFYLGNYFRVCKQIEKLPIELLLLSALELPKIRRKALITMSFAYSCKNVTLPASELKDILLYNDHHQVLNDCKYYNLEISAEDIIFKKGKFDLKIKLKEPCHCNFIDRQLENISISDFLLGSKEN